MSSSDRCLIGMLRATGSPGLVATAMAMAARCQGADLVFFRPADIAPDRRRIRAKAFDGTRWTEVDSRYPDIVENDDACLSGRYWDGWAPLRETAAYTTRRLGGKAAVARLIAGCRDFDPLIIPQSIPQDDADIARGLETFGEIVLKPVFGSQGRNVWKLRRRPGGLHLQGPGVSEDLPQVDGLHRRITGGRRYLLQKYVESRTDAGNPFDIRLHSRRDGTGAWTTVKIYARIGLSGSITSNVATGGSIGEALPLLAQRYGQGAPAVMQALERLARDIPVWTQSVYKAFRIDALGIDLGLDAAGRPWLFEINSFPGAKYFEVADAIPRIGYCLHLAGRPSGA